MVLRLVLILSPEETEFVTERVGECLVGFAGIGGDCREREGLVRGNMFSSGN